MSRKLKIRSRAKRDLRALVAYIAKANQDFLVAKRVAKRLLDRCQSLSNAPFSGTALLAHPNVRKLVEHPYKIFYQVSDERILILRIWDGRRGRDPLL